MPHPQTPPQTTTPANHATAQSKPVYLSLSVNPHTHVLQVACSFWPAPGQSTGVAEAMALDLVNAAHKRGATVLPSACAHKLPNHLFLLALAHALLDPEELALSATPEMRDMARLGLGQKAAETSLYSATGT